MAQLIVNTSQKNYKLHYMVKYSEVFKKGTVLQSFDKLLKVETVYRNF